MEYYAHRDTDKTIVLGDTSRRQEWEIALDVAKV